MNTSLNIGCLGKGMVGNAIFNALQLQNTKLKAKNKFTKIGAGLVVGGLVYLMIAK